jgi:RNA polymerase sigma-70 factor (ECF subfamily)
MNRPSSIVVPHPAAPAEGIEGYFRAYSGYVAAIAVRLLGRRDEVDDVVQEVFLAAIRGVARLREPAAVKAWLATVTARTVARRLRRRRLRSFLGLDDTAYDDRLAVGATQDQAALVQRIYRILDQLPVNQRIAWTLRHVEGEQLGSVAMICGCSLATAKRRIVAAQEYITKAVRDGSSPEMK